MKSDFVATVSHELRTPLTSILGYLQIVDEGGSEMVTPRGREHLEVVLRNAKKLDPDTIGQVIDLKANIEVGSFDYFLDPEKLLHLPPEEVIGRDEGDPPVVSDRRRDRPLAERQRHRLAVGPADRRGDRTAPDVDPQPVLAVAHRSPPDHTSPGSDYAPVGVATQRMSQPSALSRVSRTLIRRAR